MTQYVYILKCNDDSLYTGCTNNKEKRLEEHNNSSKGAKYTRARRPVKMIYSESFETLKEARAREYAIKQLTRKDKLNLIKK